MKYKILYIVLFTGFIAFSGCQKNFLDVNINPNSPSNADPALVFTNALATTARIVSVDYLFMNGTQNYYGASSQSALPGPVGTNNFSSSDFANTWNDNYHNLNDYAFIEQMSEKTNKWFLAGAAKTMKTLNFQMLVDTYNDVPYSESLQLTSGNSTPKYDKAQDVYNACILQLDSAVAIFSNQTLIAGYNPGKADIMFAGNATKWIKFANTLKLRMLLHEINVGSQKTNIQAEMEKIANDPVGLMGEGENAMVNPGYASDASNHLSPLYSSLGYSITGSKSFGGVANSYFVNKLKAYNDPRLGYFYNTNAAGFIIGNSLNGGSGTASYLGGPINTANINNLPFNFKASAGATIPSTWGILQSPTQSSIILSSWESLFLQAEAVQRGLLPGNAGDLYNKAVTQSFIYLNVFTDGNTLNTQSIQWANSYLAQNIPNVGWSASSGNPIEAILTQKYISLSFTAPLESWTDYRRTGYPNDLPISDVPTRVYDYPYRFIYPQSEYNTNSMNVQPEGLITPVSPKIFWML